MAADVAAFRALPARHRVAFALLLVATFAVRWWLFEPSLIHANFHGGPLLESILDPLGHRHRAEYGPVSFVALGALARVLGRSLAGVAAANQLLSTLTLGLMAVLAFRWTRRPEALHGTVALGALNPLFARVGASEDAHVVAVFLAWIGLVALDVHATTRRRWFLAVGAVALAIVPFARQTLYLWPPLAFGLAVARSDGRALRWRETWIAGGVVAAALVVRVHSTFGVGTDLTSIAALPLFLSRPPLVTGLLGSHPFLDVGRFAAVYLPLGVLGIVALLRRSRRVGVAFVAAVAAYFVLTLPFSFRNHGVELGFRLPVATLAFVAVGCSVPTLLRAARRSRALGIGVVALLSVSPAALPGFAYAREVTPYTREHRWIARVAAGLPRSIAVVDLGLDEPQPSYVVSHAALREAGVDARRVTASDVLAGRAPSDRPVYFVDGLGCRGFSIRERLTPVQNALPDGELMRYLIDTAFPALVRGEEPPGLAPTPAGRDVCAALLARSTPVLDTLRIEHAPHELPFVSYPVAPLTLTLRRLTP